MSAFSTSYENAENVLTTISQATTKKELVSLYLNNQHHVNSNSEVRRSFMKRLDEFDKAEAQEEGERIERLGLSL